MKSLCVVKLYEGNVCEESYEEKVLIKKRHVEKLGMPTYGFVMQNIVPCVDIWLKLVNI